MKIVLNGTFEEIDEGSAVAGVVARVVEGDASRGVAVALNGEVVPKGEWADRSLAEGDRIEILRAIGGG
jgi:sulfur carrier protein